MNIIRYTASTSFKASYFHIPGLMRTAICLQKQKELYERGFTDFHLGDWDVSQINSLAELARSTDKKFEPYLKDPFNPASERAEGDSYDKTTSFIRRAFVEGSPKVGFKIIEREVNPFSDDGRLMANPLIQRVLSYIYELLPDVMRPEEDRIEISLIRQCASRMSKLKFHQDTRRLVFILVLACNIEMEEGAIMQLQDSNRILSLHSKARWAKWGIPLIPVEDEDYHQIVMCSRQGNGYLIQENTDSSKANDQYVEHSRGGWRSKQENPERITLRILVDDKKEAFSEAI